MLAFDVVVFANRFSCSSAGVLCLILAQFVGAASAAGQSPSIPFALSGPHSDVSTFADEPKFRTYNEAIAYVRSHYRGESFDTGRSSWITRAEYYHAAGRGYLILGMRGRLYIFARLPRTVWKGFKGAPSLGRYYHRHVRGRYRFELD